MQGVHQMNVVADEMGKGDDFDTQDRIEEIDVGEIEAGEIKYEESVRFDSREHHDKTASKLAIIILSIFTVSFVGHYIISAVLVAYSLQSTADHISELFEIWLPLISGFTGSTVTYYFTREKR